MNPNPFKPGYNTQNEDMMLPEYGRNVHCMARHLREIADRQERARAASQIIKNIIIRQQNFFIGNLNFLLVKELDGIVNPVLLPCWGTNEDRPFAHKSKVGHDRGTILA